MRLRAECWGGTYRSKGVEVTGQWIKVQKGRDERVRIFISTTSRKRFGNLRWRWEDKIQRDIRINWVAMCAPDAPGSRWSPGNAAVKFQAKGREGFVHLSNTSLSWIQLSGESRKSKPMFMHCSSSNSSLRTCHSHIFLIYECWKATSFRELVSNI